jgi:hypothetical protein
MNDPAAARRLGEAVAALDVAAAEYGRQATDQNASDTDVQAAADEYLAAVQTRNAAFDAVGAPVSLGDRASGPVDEQPVGKGEQKAAA